MLAPNRKQWEFICSPYRETVITGPAQVAGKTTALVILMTYDATGHYPKEFTGHRFDKPIKFALGGATGATTRDLMTDRFLGPKGARGYGMLPFECIEEDLISYMSGGVKDQVDKIKVRWLGPENKWDGKTYSEGYVFSYASGWRRMRGYTLDAVYPDEETPMEVYDELSARLNFTGGYYRNSMIPEEGETEYFLMFEKATHEGSAVKRMIFYNIYDCDHIDQDRKDFLIEKYRLHPRAETFLMGMPVRSEGLIYKQPEEELVIDDFKITSEYHQIIGLDFPHTTGAYAAARFAYDKSQDIVYLTGCYKCSRKERPVYARATIEMGGDVVPCAWPGDAAREMDHRPLHKAYSDLGVNMLRDSAHFIVDHGKKSVSTWAAIEDIIDRCATGRFKIFRSCQQYLEERRKYRQDKGQIKKAQDDHIIDASHKAIMMLRHAKQIDYTGHSKMDFNRNRDFFSASRPVRGGALLGRHK